MNELHIHCYLREQTGNAKLQEITTNWFDKHIPDLDYTSIFSIDGDYDRENGIFINKTGTVAIGDSVFYADNGCDELEEYTEEYDQQFLENLIRNLEYYIMLSELEIEGKLEELGILGFVGVDGSAYGYGRDLEEAKKYLTELLSNNGKAED